MSPMVGARDGGEKPECGESSQDRKENKSHLMVLEEEIVRIR